MTNYGKATGGIVLTVIVAALMVLSVALVAVAAAPTASSGAGATGAAVYAAPAVTPPTTTPFTLTLNPTVFTFSAGLLSTIVTASGATFTANALVHFCASTTSAFTVATPQQVGTYQLPLTTTTMSNVAVTLSGGDGAGGITAAGTYYIAATDSSSCATAPTATYTAPVAITVTTVAPTVSVAASPTIVGSSDGLSGSGWDAGATVTVYLTQAPAALGGSPVTGSQVLGTFTTTSGGGLPASASFTVPTLPMGTYQVVAQETSGPVAAVSVGITADSSFTIEPAITVSPFYFSGAASSVLTISGTGFAAGDTIAAAATASSVIEISAPAVVQTTHLAATASSLGVFSGISVTTATAQSAAHSGSQTISITAGSGTYTFAQAVFVSNPNPGGLGFAFAPSSLTPTAAITAEAWNFPAGATITFLVGSVVVGTETASSLGFAQLPATAVLPGMPAGSYEAVAADLSTGLYSSTVAVTVTTLYAATDPSGAALGAEYLPSGGMITVSAYGLIPGAVYFITDTFLGSIGASGDVVSVSVGSLSAATGSFSPGANGTLIFTYAAAYAGIAGGTTGTTSTIAVVSPVVSIDTYKSIGTPGVSISDYTSFKAGATSVSVGFTNLIPGTATALYSGSPAVSTLYNVYIGTSILTGTSGTTPACSATAPTVCSASAGGTLTLYFTVPSATGVTDLAIVYNGQPTSAALATVPVVVSSPGASAGSGTIAVVVDPTSFDTMIVGFNLLPGAASYGLNISTSSGVVKVVPTVSAAGAMTPYDLTGSGYMDEPAGTYSIILFVVSATGSSASLTTSYTVGALLTITSPALANGPIGTTIDASASGLAPSAYYDLYFAGAYEATLQATSAGDVATIVLTVPDLAPGAYALSLDPTGTTTVFVSATFTVTAPTSIVMTPDPSAFPGQLVDFLWTPAVAPTIGVSSIEVTVLLNGTAFTTLPAVDVAGTLSGSFLMPNAPPGSSWFLQLEWSQSTVSAGGSVYQSYTSAGIISLQLVAGSGAFVLSISQSDMVEIATLSGANVNITLANLGAKISGIYAVGNKTFASLTTGFGNMTTSLSAIDATVTANAAGIANIQNGLVTIDSTLGTMTAALSAIGATVATVSDNVIVLNSTLGQMNTTLTALNANVASVAGGVATLTTDVGQMQVNLNAIGAQLTAFQTSTTGTLATITSTLGTMTASLNSIGVTVTSIQSAVNIAVGDLVVVQSDLGSINGTVLSINGGIATIQTSLGTLQTSVNNLPTTNNSPALNTLTTLLYVVIVLVIITLALAAVLLTRAGRRPPSEPPRAFEAPKTP